MAEISASLVMDLRQKTGAKMMDAKKALVEADGDMTRAIELLREKGQADASKRSGRSTAEGLIVTMQSECKCCASMIELNCETDFVAKNDEFKKVADEMAAFVLKGDKAELGADDLPEDKVAIITAAIAKTGENMNFRRGKKLASANGVVETYIHLGGKIGVLVQIDGAKGDVVAALAKDLAMQVAASSPEYLNRESVPESVIESEKEIYRNLARNEGKKEEFLDKIAIGRLDKFMKDNCLLEQVFIKDTDKQIKDIVADVSKAAGAPLSVAAFVRFQLGQ
jgi:elongation factor Ts